MSTPLASGLVHPIDLALDDRAVYWVDAAEGKVGSVRKSGGDDLVLAEGLEEPSALALDQTHVYVAFGGEEGTIGRVSKSGGTVEPVVEGSCFPVAIQIGGQFLFWAEAGDDRDNGRIMRVALTGGSPEVVADGQIGPQDLGHDETGVYWLAADDHLYIVEHGVAAVRVLYRADEPTVERLMNPPVVYEFRAGLRLVEPALRGRRRIAVSAECVYWRNAAGTLLETTWTGQDAPEETAASRPIIVGCEDYVIALDEQTVYWTDGKAIRCAGVDDGLGRVFAQLPSKPIGLAVDESNVYWSTDAGVFFAAKAARQ